MSMNYTLLFIKDERSDFDASTKALQEFFKSVETAADKEEALKLFGENVYDIVLADLSFEPERLGMLKQLQDMKKEQMMFAFLTDKDTDKLYGIADLGINAFEISPEQFDQALEAIGDFNPES